MKSFILNLLGGVALMCAAAACSSEEPVAAPADNMDATGTGETTELTICAALPEGVRSRAAAEPRITAADMKNLHVGVYMTPDMSGTGSYKLISSKVLTGDELAAALVDGKFQVKLSMPIQSVADGNPNYTVFCWADNKDAEYYRKAVNLEKGEVNVGLFYGTNAYDTFAFAGETIVDSRLGTQQNVKINLQRPYAEVALVSNQTESESFASVWGSDMMFTWFGNPAEDNISGSGTTFYQMEAPSVWHFLTNKVDKSFQGHLAGGFPVHYQYANFPELVEGYKTIFMRNVFVPTKAKPEDYEFLFTNNMPAVKDYGQEADVRRSLVKFVPSLTLQPNHRYIFVDNKENGSFWDGDLNLTIEVSGEIDDSDESVL